MEQIGYVVKLCGDKIKVRVERESSCGGNCASCKGCPSNAVIIECAAPQAVKVGDTVKLVMRTKSFFANAAVGYGFPVLLMIIGAIVGYYMGKSETASVFGVILGLAAAMVLLKILPLKTGITAEILNRVENDKKRGDIL